MKKIVYFIILNIFPCVGWANQPFLEECHFEKLTPVERSKKEDIYIAKYGEIELIFGDGENSSEHYVKISGAKEETTCSIDHGVWDYDQIYLTKDTRFAFLGAYSGSSSEIAIYSTVNCNLIESIDVFTSDFKIEKRSIKYNGGCEYIEDNVGYCNPAAVYELDKNCNLIMNMGLSKELTFKNYGILFDKKYTKIKNPKSKNSFILDEIH